MNKALSATVIIAAILLFCFEWDWMRGPISIGFRTSLMDSTTCVLQVANRSTSEALDVSVNVSGDNERATRFLLPPLETKELGILEMGTGFKPGESVSVSVHGYLLSRKCTVPAAN